MVAFPGARVLTFLTSIRNPRNSNDYARVWRLFDDTCRSVLGQTSADIDVLVVANEVPEVHRRRWAGAPVRFLDVDFDPPSPIRAAATPLEAARIDKGSKYAAGLVSLRAAPPDHVMLFDADDFVHRDLAAFVQAGPADRAWIVTHGWWLKGGRVAPLDTFDRRCGTSAVVPFAAYDGQLPSHLRDGCSQDDLFATVDHEVLRLLLGSHAYTAHRLRGRGVDVQAVPFRAAIRTLATGENHSDHQVDPPSAFDTTTWVPIDRSLVTAFTLPARWDEPGDG